MQLIADDSAAAECVETDELHVVAPRAAGQFSALPQGLRELTAWLQGHGVTAAAMEGTGVYWLAPYEALEAVGIQPALFHAQHVKQIKGRKTDKNDSRWLARICQFGLAMPSYVPPRRFRQLRQLCRYRRKLVGERSRARNRLHKTLDHDGLRLGGALSDILGMNGRRILGGLTSHVRAKLGLLAQTLEARLDPHSLWKLRDLLQAIDALNARMDTDFHGGYVP